MKIVLLLLHYHPDMDFFDKLKEESLGEFQARFISGAESEEVTGGEVGESMQKPSPLPLRSPTHFLSLLKAKALPFEKEEASIRAQWEADYHQSTSNPNPNPNPNPTGASVMDKSSSKGSEGKKDISEASGDLVRRYDDGDDGDEDMDMDMEMVIPPAIHSSNIIPDANIKLQVGNFIVDGEGSDDEGCLYDPTMSIVSSAANMSFNDIDVDRDLHIAVGVGVGGVLSGMGEGEGEGEGESEGGASYMRRVAENALSLVEGGNKEDEEEEEEEEEEDVISDFDEDDVDEESEIVDPEAALEKDRSECSKHW